MPEPILRRGALKSGKVTIRDVARVVGVTPSTVSLVLSGRKPISQATRTAVEKAVRELGYTPNPHATRLAQGHTSDLVSLFSLTVDFGVGTWLMQELQQRLHARKLRAPIHGFSYHSVEHPADQVDLVRELCAQRPRAILCSTAGVHPDALTELSRFAQSGGILIAVSYGAPAPVEGDQIIYDEYVSAMQATNYLLERGHRRIGIFNIGRFVLKNRRWEGWYDALLSAGITPHDDWAMAHGGIDGFEVGSLWLAQHLADWPVETRPTAMLVINDYAALIFTAAAQARGLRIPDDLSVIGWDNLPVSAYGRVPLTTLAHPVLRIADRVIETLDTRLQGHRGDSETIHLPGELIERSSVAPFLVSGP